MWRIQLRQGWTPGSCHMGWSWTSRSLKSCCRWTSHSLAGRFCVSVAETILWWVHPCQDLVHLRMLPSASSSGPAVYGQSTNRQYCFTSAGEENIQWLISVEYNHFITMLVNCAHVSTVWSPNSNEAIAWGYQGWDISGGKSKLYE